VNPEVIVLLAQPITSGKLPKYSYIPELHGELAKLASRLDRAESPVRIVPQGEGFDPHKDTVADLVHPNESGAAKMAGRWFEALVKVLENPGTSF
jgi:lysophospholipase L1-like esterase